MNRPQREPEASSWTFPSPIDAEDELVAVGGDLAPGSLLAAYRTGLFPMPLNGDGSEVDPPGGGLIGWWSPDPRGILELDGLRVTRSMRRSARGYRVTFDTAFEQVMRECADPRREGGWINEEFIGAYTELHTLGWARSVEVWSESDGHLVGGLYGVAIGAFFAGESMFSRGRDASKVALMALVDQLRTEKVALLDVQWCTEHLRTLGAVEIPRKAYVERLAAATGGTAPLSVGHSDDSP